MKHVLTATAVALAMTAAASATPPGYYTPSGFYLWQGDGFVTKLVTPSLCKTSSNQVGKLVQVVFQPAANGIFLSNGAQDQLIFFSAGELSVNLWTPVSGASLNGVTQVNGQGIDTGGYHNGGGTPLTVTLQITPPIPTLPVSPATTTAVNISGTVTEKSGCKFQMAAHLLGPF